MQGKAEAVPHRDRAGTLVQPALALLAISIAAYGLLLPQLGFYWDELPMSWIRYELGPAAMTRYFSTNRPVWGMLYQLTTAILPQVPIYWEVLCLLLRWASSVLVWLIAVNLWPKRRELAAITATAFLLYPGFNQQWTSYLYSHFFFVLCFLLLSFICSMWAIQRPDRRVPLTAVGLALSALNLWMMEYFFVLELLRPVMLWRVGRVHEPAAPRRSMMRLTLIRWLPYLAVFAANILWRLLVFNNQVYRPTLGGAVRASPLQAVARVLLTAAQQLHTTLFVAWSRVAELPSIARDGPRSVAYYAGVTVVVGAIFAVLIGAIRRQNGGPARWDSGPILMGIAGMVLAGGPFLLTGLEVTTAYPANRFTLPFMLGAGFVLAGLSMLIPQCMRIWIIAILMGLAGGRQALWAEAYRADWVTQKSLFWQMLWRAPGLEPGTTVLLNEGALPYYADNSLIGPLNWIYDPDNRSASMDYALFYPTSRAGGTLPQLTAGIPIQYDFIAEAFSGNTSQTLALYFRPPGCLRVLDPEIDGVNRLIPDDSLMREAALLSSSQWIHIDAEARMPQIYGPEPERGWCYYFERAGLAAQQDQWNAVVELGDAAFTLQDHPNDPTERFVFIEGYAHTGDWKRALELSGDSYRVSRTVVGPILCRLWARIERDTMGLPGRSAAVAEVKSMLACTRE